MIQIDDTTKMLQAALGGQATTTPPPPQAPEGLVKLDSTTTALKDSISNMNISDIKAVVTGENTILKDGLRTITELTVGFIPKLLIAILILWIGMKLAKMLKKLIVKALEKRGAEPSLKTFLG